MPTLYLIRHGIADEPELHRTDEERALTKEGDRKTRKVAQKLLDMGVSFDLILTSPLVRARQTAEILQATGLGKQLEESEILAPAGQITQWLDWYYSSESNQQKTIALVGHQPNLGNWAEILVWGEARGVLVVKKAGVIGLTLPEQDSPVGNSQLFCLTPPKFLLS
ncbi:MAG: phosphohistidine phosphatase SixA [Microcoleaceae cyanobacterium]